jgi:1-acyl-sn-glycerol-3-phosphate acyltransferase
METTPRRLPLPGGKVAVATPAEWLRAMLAGSLLLGPRYLALVAAGRSGNRRLLHTLERSWAHAAAKAVDLKVEVAGVSSIDPAERYVVAPLHESLADAIALQRLPLDLTFAARDELFTWRFLGGYLRAAAHPLVPTHSDRSAYRGLLRGAQRAFAAGESVVVFPQGSILGVEIAFQPGAFRIAARFGRPLLPVVLTGGHDVWEHPYSPRLRSGATIRLEVLDPVPAAEAVAAMRDTERAMKRRALQLEPGPRRFEPDRDGWWDGYPYEIDHDFGELRDRVEEHRRRIRREQLVSVRSG